MRFSSFIACLTICSLFYLTSCTSKPSDVAVSPSPSVIVEQSPHPTDREVNPEPTDFVVIPSSPIINESPRPNTEELVTEVLEAKIIYNPDITFEELKKSVRLGEHIDETIKILGNNYDKYPSYYTGSTIIRYYYANVEDYSYEFTHIHDDIVNDLDREGLLNENVKYQLVVWISNDLTRSYAIAYKHTDGNIHMYYEWVDGSSKEDIYE